MSATEERAIDERVGERPELDPGKAKDVRPRDLAFRFIAGAVTSIAAGLITLAFGARVGGMLLAFPAILAASLTLIEEEEDSADAREDARGAVMGGLALAAFGGVAALTFTVIPGGLALVAAAAAWTAVALGGYWLLWR